MRRRSGLRGAVSEGSYVPGVPCLQEGVIAHSLSICSDWVGKTYDDQT